MTILFIPMIPVLFFLLDGYYEKDIKKGLKYIFAFVGIYFTGILMLHLIGWTFALWTPVLLIVMLLVKPKHQIKKSKSK